MSDPKRKVCLCLFAHPDDAEILCAGTLIRLRDAGWQLHIATATAGDCGSMSLGPAAIARVRLGEAKKAAKLIGATYHCLGEKDVLVMYDKPTTRKAIDLFRSVAPSLVFTHARRDYMLDHEQIHLLARAASFAYAVPNASKRKLLAGSMVPYLYYCDPIEGIDPYAAPIKPTTLIDITEQLELKLKMLACHASQRDWLRVHHGMDEYLDAVRRHAQQRGRQARTRAAEAFIQHRGHAYPKSDLLKTLFPQR